MKKARQSHGGAKATIRKESVGGRRWEGIGRDEGLYVKRLDKLTLLLLVNMTAIVKLRTYPHTHTHTHTQRTLHNPHYALHI